LYFGGIDESATPYLQVGNMSSASGGATAVYPMALQPHGGEVWVGTTSGVSNSGYGGFSLNDPLEPFKLNPP
jgi:hypothetical protein